MGKLYKLFILIGLPARRGGKTSIPWGGGGGVRSVESGVTGRCGASLPSPPIYQCAPKGGNLLQTRFFCKQGSSAKRLLSAPRRLIARSWNSSRSHGRLSGSIPSRPLREVGSATAILTILCRVITLLYEQRQKAWSKAFHAGG